MKKNKPRKNKKIIKNIENDLVSNYCFNEGIQIIYLDKNSKDEIELYIIENMDCK